jgi:hypothetical protein
MVGRDDGASLFGLGVDEIASRYKLGRNVEFGVKLILPLGAKELWRHDEDLGHAVPSDQLAGHQACGYCFAESYIIRQQRNGQSATEGDEILDLMVKGLEPVFPALLGSEIVSTFDDYWVG